MTLTHMKCKHLSTYYMDLIEKLNPVCYHNFDEYYAEYYHEDE